MCSSHHFAPVRRAAQRRETGTETVEDAAGAIDEHPRPGADGSDPQAAAQPCVEDA